MGLIFMPKITLNLAISQSKTTKEANEKFLKVLIHKEYTRILKNWGEKDMKQAEINAKNLMLDLRSRV